LRKPGIPTVDRYDTLTVKLRFVFDVGTEFTPSGITGGIREITVTFDACYM